MFYREVFNELLSLNKRTLPVHALWCIIATKAIYRLALKQKYVFREVRAKANLHLMWLVYSRDSNCKTYNYRKVAWENSVLNRCFCYVRERNVLE